MSFFGVIVSFMIVYLTREWASGVACSLNEILCGALGLIAYFLLIYFVLTRLFRL